MALGSDEVQLGIDPGQHPAGLADLAAARRRPGSPATPAPGRSCRSGWRSCWSWRQLVPPAGRSPAPAAARARPSGRGSPDRGSCGRGAGEARSRSCWIRTADSASVPGPARRAWSRSSSANLLRSAAARLRRAAGLAGSACLPIFIRPATAGGVGKSRIDIRRTCRSWVSTSGRGESRRSRVPGSMTSTQPRFLPPGTCTMSPGFRLGSTRSDSARRSEARSRAASASSSPICARSRAYSTKSPRSQAAAANAAWIAALFRASVRAMPTTDRSDWNCANDCSSSVRARSRPTLATRLTAML